MTTTPTTLEISSLEDLESAIRHIGPGEPVLAVFAGARSLFEAATIYSRLHIQVTASHGLWQVDPCSLEGLRRATEHYKELDLLEISVDLMELDLKDGVPMKVVRFTGVRATANDVVTTAHPSNAFGILDDITIEAQLIARVAKALGFGGEEVEVPNLTEDDFVWLTADGAAVMLADGGGGHHVEQQDAEVGLGNLDIGSHGINYGQLGRGDGVRHVEPEDAALGLGDLHIGNGDGERHVEVGRSEGGHHVELGIGNLSIKDLTLDGQHDAGGFSDDQLRSEDGLGCPKVEVDWIEMKRETVLAILHFKIGKLRAAISSAKGRAFIGS
ncbi:unnamed protein product [Urochloa decumbens]|uniref:Uncharacterized protein n=1 Tax=Urochloa decumbens TaxID=240449 RepID=A0ABC8Y4G1_9POAL